MKRTKKASIGTQLKNAKLKKEKEQSYSKADLVPMGSTLLNLAMSDCIEGGAKKGTMINIIGASHGGKTILALTSFAEANMNDSFENYAFIYDDVERANSFNMEYMFGESCAKRIKAPKNDEEYSPTVQHFQANVLKLLNKEKPFIYVLDSFDALDSLEDIKKVKEMVSGLEKGKETAGTYGMAKAKAASSILRGIANELANTKSILFIVSQTRDNVDLFSPQKETRSGGRALKFYAHHEMWLKPIKTLTKNGIQIGSTVEVKVSKNKLTGKVRKVKFNIYYDYGIDDIGSCIDFLLETKRWNGGGQSKINFKNDFEFDSCLRSKLISLIEENGLQRKLQKLVKREWDKIEDSLKLNRKSKYK